jgi:SnoaL-like domain
MNDIERLLAIEDISQLKARYFRAIDTKDWELLRSCFADDVTVDFTAAGATELRTAIGLDPVTGADAAVAWIASVCRPAVTTHHGHMPEIALQSSDEASGVWAMWDRLEYRSPQDGPFRIIDGVGHYHETYRRLDGAWRIATLRLTRLRSEETRWDA